jgi:hypothetical protein
LNTLDIKPKIGAWNHHNAARYAQPSFRYCSSFRFGRGETYGNRAALAGDAQTGLANRRQVLARLNMELRLAGRSGYSLSVLKLDLLLSKGLLRRNGQNNSPP